MRKVELSRNLMERQIIRQVLLWASCPKQNSKRQNPWNLVFKKFGSGKTDDASIAIRESRDTFLDVHAMEHCVLNYPFVV